MTLLQTTAGGAVGAGGTGAVLIATGDNQLASNLGLATGAASAAGAGVARVMGAPTSAQGALLGYGVGAAGVGAAARFGVLPGGGNGDAPTGQYDRELNAVQDLGADPNGNTPIDGAIANAVRSNTKINFPEGTYLVEEGWSKEAVSNFGIFGLGSTPTDVTFIPVKGNSVGFLKDEGTGPFEIRNVSFNDRSDTASNIWMGMGSPKGGTLKNIEWLGKTPLSGSRSYQIDVNVPDKDGKWLVENVNTDQADPAVMGEISEGMSFITTFTSHAGEVEVVDCTIEERANMALELDGGTGIGTVSGCSFSNNSNTDIWIGSGDHPDKTSSIESCSIDHLGDRNAADAIRVTSYKNPTGGLTINTVDIEWSGQATRGLIAAPDWGNHGGMTIRNAVLKNDGTQGRTMYFGETTAEDATVEVVDSHFTGSGGDITAADRPGSEVRDSCINMPNGQIVGMTTSNLELSGCETPSGNSQRLRF